ncbi:LysR family transcriptional regulator ArgP [Limimaricola pyoseonensis]|uniref:LysR family transcriptional regulator, chromosome initiation inhibitor n=1 Tax=Limimaricola pyoseonensis TaxID=521013 RepID=A0A1G7CZ31_9RHOB|nr:LysR family transcriptional regulator ArgP [Limimaricola pyoseonensis]SDE44531.1 LysR family transcriptional regulator, chromosome initiation inhibitor [Limimaricola pyoseonensis]
MMDYPALAALAAVLRTGSFDLAASALAVTPSAVSQRVRGLEERLGAVLVERGRPCRATAAGARLLRHHDEVRLLEAGLDREIGVADSGWPTVHLAVNADSLATWFLPALAGHEMLFDLSIDDQEHSADQLRRGAVSAAVTSRSGPVQGCDSEPLGALRYRAMARRDVAERWFPEGVDATALAAAPSLVYDARDRLQADWAERVSGRPVALPAHRIASTQGFLDAVRLGLGWAMIPEVMLPEDRDLVELSPVPLDTPLHWQVARGMAGPLEALTRAVRRAARAALVQNGTSSA